jgi:hypothetical protein
MESGIGETTLVDPETTSTWMGQELTEEQKVAIRQYKKFNTQNKHKMLSIPPFKL